MEYDLLKYRNFQVDNGSSALRVLHYHNRLVEDNVKEVLDPYPGKHMLNINVLVESLGRLIKNLVQALARRRRG